MSLFIYCYAERRFAQSHYAECRALFVLVLIVIMLAVVVLSVIGPSEMSLDIVKTKHGASFNEIERHFNGTV